MAMLVLHLRAARRRARAAAVAEALALLHDLGPSAPAGGPLSERGGVFWVELPGRQLAAATARLPRLGYTTAVDLLAGVESGEARPGGAPAIRWRQRRWRLVRLHEEDAAGHREQAPDRRVFLFPAGGGPARPVRGYRGGADPLARRGLPVCDARLLVNLVAPAGPGLLLDPFAGVGGVALAAMAAGWTTVTADLDPALGHGLGRLGGAHLVADARSLPLRAGAVDAVATEPPYDRGVGPLADQALAELHRLLRPGGAVALLCADWQAAGLRATGAALGLRVALDCPVDRKGVAVVALAWRKPPA
ncbi:MAG TPA: methyltransferase domain-containing protein, partial [Actinomycetes bacterium]|nr:methyltransferase domain-containing protein [Actinomycetes bacterium]